MRGGARVLFVLATLIFLSAVAIPAASGIATLIGDDAARDGAAPPPVLRLSLVTAAWAASVALGACVIAWIPAQLLASATASPRRRFVPVAALCIVAVCLPPYLVFWCWWQAWPSDSWLHEWVVRHGLMSAARGVTLWISLVLWAWPIVAWTTAASLRMLPRAIDDLSRLDGASALRRTLMRARLAAPGVAIGAVIVFLFIFNNTTAFDLAQVSTLGYELRAMVNTGESAPAILRAAPAGMVASIACIGIAILLSRRAGAPRAAAAEGPVAGGWRWALAAIIWLLTLAGPLIAIFSQPYAWDSYRMVISGYWEAAARTLIAAAIAGGMGVLIAIGLAIAWGAGRGWAHHFAWAQAIGWALGATVPAMVVAVSIEAAFNTDLLSEIAYRTPGAIVAGYLARFGVVAVIIGVWIALQEPHEIRDMRRLDGAVTLRGHWQAGHPRFIAGAAAAFAAVTMLSVSEIIVTAQLQPPGFDAIAGILLSNMHYQRNEMVVLMAGILLVLAVCAAFIIALSLHGGAAFRREASRAALP